MARMKVELLLDMFEHKRLGEMYLDQAEFVNKLGNTCLAEYYLGKARRHAEEYLRIEKLLNGNYATLVLH